MVDGSAIIEMMDCVDVILKLATFQLRRAQKMWAGEVLSDAP
jgi:hypothetical protein